MERESTRFLQVFYRLADTTGAAALLVGVLMIANLGAMPRGLEQFLTARVTAGNLLLVAIFLIGYHFAFEFAGVYDQAGSNLRKQAETIAAGASIASFLVAVFPFLSRSHAFTWRLVIVFWISSIPLAVALRATVHFARTHLKRERPREVIIVGSGPRALKLSRELEQNHSRHFRIQGFVDSPGGHRVPEEIQRRMLGSLQELDQLLMRRVVDDVMIALPVKSCYDQIQGTIAVCEQAGVESEYLSDAFQHAIARPEYGGLDHQPMVRMKVVEHDYRLVIKRAIDVAGSLFGLIFLTPVMLAVAIAIKLTSPGPVLFKQERYGLNKRRFGMLKFRTMVPDAENLQAVLEHRNEAEGPVFKIRDDPRITRIGRTLRKTSLDELPQLWNVLRGEMSLVGPRPLPARDVSRFDRSSLLRRFSVKPGLTCLWQIHGRSDTSFTSWIMLDLEYIDSWSLVLDFWILLRTVPAVLRARGAV
jgi:exopolysaccharide biosynthesis polyprenyl glycosylphosphotransferase